MCAELSRRGIRTVLLSGDSRDATAAVAEAIGAREWHGEATPEGKIEILRQYQQSGRVVAMIGDGVNDAPSLAQADLGVAMASGADIAMQAAPLVLMNNSLAAVVETAYVTERDPPPPPPPPPPPKKKKKKKKKKQNKTKRNVLL